MKRRRFISLLGGAAAAWPLAASAQQPAMPVIGLLGTRSLEVDGHLVAAVRQGLSETGYFDGQNLHIEYRFAEGRLNRLPAMAAELVDRRVVVMVAAGGPAALVAKAATTTIPIVFSTGSDPVKDGLVESLNQPRGNLTGVTTLAGELGSKQVKLLQEVLPQPTTFAFLTNPEQASAAPQTTALETAARAIGRQLLVLRVSTEREIDAAFAKLAQQRIRALLVSSSAFLTTRVNQIVVLAAHYAIPTLYPIREYVAAGGLISYGTSFAAAYRQVGVYVGRILKGTKPADLPVQLPTKFELVINLKTTKTLGLDIPPGVLAIADEVIE